jgi:hypothetical protein
VVQCKLLVFKRKIYEIIRNRKSIRKQRDKLTSYFKLAKKLKEFQNGCTPLVMIALFGRKTDGYLLQANVIETLICGLLTCAQNKRYILGTNSEMKILQRDKRIWRNINRQHYV